MPITWESPINLVDRLYCFFIAKTSFKVSWFSHYHNCSDLHEFFIKGSTKISSQETADLLKSLALGISQVHSNRLIHKDIKLENLLVEKVNSISKQKIYYKGSVIDLEFAEDVDAIFTEKKGSPPYIPPEVYQRSMFTKEDYSRDWYSFGIVIAYLYGIHMTIHEYQNQFSVHRDALLSNTLRLQKKPAENTPPFLVKLNHGLIMITKRGLSVILYILSNIRETQKKKSLRIILCISKILSTKGLEAT